MGKRIQALTLKGEERHIYELAPGEIVMPADARAFCGKLLRYRLRSQPWAEKIPTCRLCAEVATSVDEDTETFESQR